MQRSDYDKIIHWSDQDLTDSYNANRVLYHSNYLTDERKAQIEKRLIQIIFEQMSRSEIDDELF